jgi:hypothetical protein
MYLNGRGGWNANGPESVGVATTSTELSLDAFTVEAIRLPNGEELDIARD